MQENFENYLTSMEAPVSKGLRVNTLYSSPGHIKELLDWPLQPVPFCEEGFFLPGDFKGAGHHPLHHAGAFYMQEPSAMSAARVLSPVPGERVLDLCAAPGGKSTQIAATMQGEGLLFSNEYVFSRVKILVSNLERCGVKNAVVTSMRPDDLCGKLPEFFDKILVDAPCSGEGMFRKEPAALKEWSVENVHNCAKRQLLILESACKALRPGGILVYSTCTFAPEENEGVILRFLEEHPEFSLLPCDVLFGSPCREEPLAAFGISSDGADVSLMRRIFPWQGGEGHFVAKLKKQGGEDAFSAGAFPSSRREENLPAEAARFWEDTFTAPPTGIPCVLQDKVFLLPHGLPDLTGMTVLRRGIEVGVLRKGRMEPSHHLFQCCDRESLVRSLDLSPDDLRLSQFLKGQTVPCPPEWKGYAGVFVEGIPLGFGKASGGVLKNHYPKGLREY